MAAVKKISFMQAFLGDDVKRAKIKVVDVGAMGGVPRYWKVLGQYVHIVAFEPDEREFAQLKSSENITYLPFALYQASQQLPFYVAREPGKSSLYRPNERVMKDFVNAERMDTIKEIIIAKDKVK